MELKLNLQIIEREAFESHKVLCVFNPYIRSEKFSGNNILNPMETIGKVIFESI